MAPTPRLAGGVAPWPHTRQGFSFRGLGDLRARAFRGWAPIRVRAFRGSAILASSRCSTESAGSIGAGSCTEEISQLCSNRNRW